MVAIWFSSAVALVALVLACLVIGRSPRHPAHLSFGAGMVVLAVETLIAALGAHAREEGQMLEWARARLLGAAFLPAPWVTFSLCFSRGDHREVLRRWWPGLLALAIAPPAIAGARWNLLAGPSLIPAVVAPLAGLGWAGYILELILLLAAIVTLTNLERTFRHAVGVMRWRMKYIVLGVGVLAAFRIYASSQALLNRSADGLLGATPAAALLVACALFGVALLRTRVFDVDVYPSQALVFGSISILLTGTYLLIVGLLSRVLAHLGAATDLPLRAFGLLVALVGLAAILLSERLRQRLRYFISRHLHRPAYDYRRVWSNFTRRTTSLVDEEAFCRAVTSWVSETFSALAVSLWLLKEGREELRLGGSTSIGDAAAEGQQPNPADLAALVEALERLREPVNIDASGEPWAATLQRLQPSVFPHGGCRVALALHAGDELLGVLLAGDRVSGVPFTAEDFDLLKCAGDQVASGLLGLQLSRQLVRAKEMEAFQTMSAFFVHDLKNTASTLSLTLRNLQQHFADPAFREDALRAVGKSVQHLNNLIARLTRLRQEAHVQPVPGDLPAVVDSALGTVGQDPKVALEKELEPVPAVLVDGAQLEKVIVNLVLNARDAIKGEGKVRVTATRQNGWGVVSVTDDGCGMSPEFVRRSLFRPFQTTKANGLGIGMFHSKMIVDAHRGRFEIESAPGRGTTIRVFLPLAPTP